MERLDGKKIVITGGTSGMGQTTVEGYSKLGAKVVFFGRNVEAGKAIEAKCGAKFIKCEVQYENEVESSIKEAVEYLGGIDVLVHAAAIDEHSNAENISLDSWNRIFDINSTGTFLINKAVFPYMKEAGGGHIINFTSASAYTGGMNQAAYAASKGAVVAWSRNIAKEWMKYNIRVNLIAPCIWTPMYDMSRKALPEAVVKAMDANLAQICLGGKLGDPETDYLPVMAFLASDSSKFITGQTVSIDGGILMVR
ncbi:MAG: SDR family oxidoreductase [Erysipelotrichaceae bacterium]|nr:SDR family oxidoreductase [Erysipelotrichaceae bacterium]